MSPSLNFWTLVWIPKRAKSRIFFSSKPKNFKISVRSGDQKNLFCKYEYPMSHLETEIPGYGRLLAASRNVARTVTANVNIFRISNYAENIFRPQIKSRKFPKFPFNHEKFLWRLKLFPFRTGLKIKRQRQKIFPRTHNDGLVFFSSCSRSCHLSQERLLSERWDSTSSVLSNRKRTLHIMRLVWILIWPWGQYIIKL